MTTPMIKINGKMVPARKNTKGKWEAIPNAELVYNKDGQLEVKKSNEKEKK